ncbi:YbhB/YbcL family Raf kinase inhibitor-like protein [Sinomonas halotolerans]|uniref:YbhB/YbcL family Raf kinase inhibitor-like protein n=1 Tax=Sinomonas halotolerans TaxID=1644133 RepID=A0ABU9WX27_9MICC
MSFEVTSQDLADGAQLPAAQTSAHFGVPGGQDLSPQLAWSGAPAGTRSFAVTVMDPDAPRGAFCHWAVVNIPLEVDSLPEGAGGAPDGMGPSGDEAGLPVGSVELVNDAGFAGFVGGAPPRGSGPHRYIATVHALDVPQLPATPRTHGAKALKDIAAHEIGRAAITAVHETR